MFYLPDEIVLYILQFLPLECLLQLGRVSKNFYQYWIQFPQLWNNVSNDCSMLFLPQVYENDERKNSLFIHKRFKPKIVNSFKYLSAGSRENSTVLLKFILAGPHG